MKVLRKDIINDFKAKHTNSAIPLDNFVETAEKAHATNPIELKKVFSGVDLWKGSAIINVGGNNYRVIAIVGWKRDQLIIEHVFTHKEYDNWCKKMRKN